MFMSLVELLHMGNAALDVISIGSRKNIGRALGSGAFVQSIATSIEETLCVRQGKASTKHRKPKRLPYAPLPSATSQYTSSLLHCKTNMSVKLA
jgi:hypothetical protein